MNRLLLLIVSLLVLGAEAADARVQKPWPKKDDKWNVDKNWATKRKQVAMLIRCTPNSVDLGGGDRREGVANPIKVALDNAGPGTVIRLTSGDYPAFGLGFSKRSPWSGETSGGSLRSPLTIRGEGRVRILPRSHGGDTIVINQARPVANVVFENLTIVPGYRSGIFFFKLKGGAHRGFKFYDCDIIGNWSHTTATGDNSKWGVWGHSLDGFEYVGRKRPAVIRNLRYEHAFYIQNPRGDILIDNVEAFRLGRTFCQFTARARDGQPGRGSIVVRNCDVHDVALSRDDGFKGGSAFTIAGRLAGPVLFEKNRYRAGFDRELVRLTRPGSPYGTGAVAIWDAGEARNVDVTLRDNHFEFAAGCGDRPVVSIGGCEQVSLLGTNRIVSGGKQPALSLDPVNERGKLEGKTNTKVVVGPLTSIAGDALRRGVKLTSEQVRALAAH